jgi:FtsH-binding integral membrane protein
MALGLTFSADGGWNLVTAIALAIAAFYTYRLWATFRGGKLDRAYSYLVWGICVLLVAVVVRLMFDLADITPIDAYYVSIRDCGLLVAAVLFGLSARDLARFWRGETR